MRRYYQAALAAIAVISLISLLFYRHEYNKLRYVLQVFNYFGKPSEKPAYPLCVRINETIAKNSEPDWSEPLTAWQRLGNDLYVYSAFGVNPNDVHLIGLARKDARLHFACNLFFQGERKPVRATFRYRTIRNDPRKDSSHHGKSLYVGYRFICSHANTSKEPVAVKLVAKANDFPLENVLFAVRPRPKSSRQNVSAICVSPALRGAILSTDASAFLAYHRVIGLEHFLLYDFGISTFFTRQLAEDLALSSTDLNLKYTILSWNFPFPGIPTDVIRDIVQEDCLHRTYGRVLFAVTLSWEEYMVPRYHNTLYDLLVDLGKTRLQADRYQLPIRSFCTNAHHEGEPSSYDNSTTKSITFLQSTHFDPDVVESRAVYIEKPDRAVESSEQSVIREIREALICVNRYIICNETKTRTFAGKGTYDPSIQRFGERLHSLKVLRLDDRKRK